MNQNDVEQLKVEWLLDPCWDIEDTPGFARYRVELLAYRLEVEEVARRAYHDKVAAFATKLETSFEVAEYIMALERRLDGMQRQIDALFELS